MDIYYHLNVSENKKHNKQASLEKSSPSNDAQLRDDKGLAQETPFKDAIA